jgi:hypothetical protein
MRQGGLVTDESEVQRDDDLNWLDNLVAYVLPFIAGVLSILSLTSITR